MTSSTLALAVAVLLCACAMAAGVVSRQGPPVRHETVIRPATCHGVEAALRDVAYQHAALRAHVDALTRACVLLPPELQVGVKAIGKPKGRGR